MTIQKFERRVVTPYQSWYKENGQFCWACLHELRVDFEICELSDLSFHGKLNLIHLGAVVGGVGWGVKATLRYHPNGFGGMPAIPSSSINLGYFNSAQPFVVAGSKCAGNIESVTEHYGTAVLGAEKWNLQPGFYRLEHWFNAHSSNAPVEPQCNGIAAVNQNRTASGALDNAGNYADPYSALFGWVKPASGEMI